MAKEPWVFSTYESFRKTLGNIRNHSVHPYEVFGTVAWTFSTWSQLLAHPMSEGNNLWELLILYQVCFSNIMKEETACNGDYPRMPEFEFSSVI